jgi:S1-C subfamily serine protease
MHKCKHSTKRIFTALALWPILLCHFCSWALAQDEMPAKVYDKVAPVVVKITAKNGNKIGSGAVVGLSPRGRVIILTACHVVAENFEDYEKDPNIALDIHQDLKVKIGLDLVFVPAAVIPTCFDRLDFALIVTRAPVGPKEIIRYNHSDGVKPGQKVAAFGFPETDQLSQTVGLITRLEEKYLIFDAKVVPGNSGGPLVDKAGRMIGLSVKTVEDEGYALPMNLVLSIADGWLKNLKLQTIWQRQKYTSTWQQMYKNPLVVLPEIGAIGGASYWLLKPPTPEEAVFPVAPNPPVE